MSIVSELAKFIKSKDAISLRSYLQHLQQVNEMTITNKTHEDDDIQLIDIKKYLDR